MRTSKHTPVKPDASTPPSPVDVEAEVDALRRRVAALENELRGRSDGDADSLVEARCADIEADHHNLAQLYVATHQIHAAVGFREVVQVVTEIVLNLVGAARFQLFLYDERRDSLCAIAGEGADVAAVPPVPLGQGVVGAAAGRRERYVRTAPPGDGAGGGPEGGPLVVVPLATVEDLVGAVVIDALLPHKPSLMAIDDELFDLLSAHGAAALAGALLREQAPPEVRRLDIDVARALLS